MDEFKKFESGQRRKEEASIFLQVLLSKGDLKVVQKIGSCFIAIVNHQAA